MPTAITTYLPSLFSNPQSVATANTGTEDTSVPVQTGSDTSNTASPDTAAATVTLSPEAQALLDSSAQAETAAAAEAGTADKPLAIVAAEARAWFDEQYETLGIESAMIDGQVAVDLTGHSRATLSAVASNTEDLFNEDEVAAAKTALQLRFDDAILPHVVIARHTGNYAGLYKAAADYLDKAGTDERETQAWQEQANAVDKGLAAANAVRGRAPDTGDADDPVAALLGKTSATGALTSDTSTESVAANARALLDDQINNALDNGTKLVFRESRQSGQMVNFATFDNRSLATMVLNTDETFTRTEVNAAKAQLNLRTRTSMMEAINSGTDSAGGSLGLLGAFANMSAEEQSVMGVTEGITNRLITNYNTMMTLQDAFNTSSALDNSFSLAAYI